MMMMMMMTTAAEAPITLVELPFFVCGFLKMKELLQKITEISRKLY
jgi:hypothetical protein